jgi:hypothetical protein
MNFQNLIDSGSQDSLASGGGSTGGGTISGTTGSICTEGGLYRATDNKAQYLQLVAKGDAFGPFPGGKGTKSCTWYLVQATTTAITGEGGSATTNGDGGFTSVIVPAGTA